MAYKKFYKKNWKKKTLKKSNIFAHKSAKSQAKQIYAINKKINYISKTTRPELQITTMPIVYKRFIDANSRPVISDYGKLYFYHAFVFNSSLPGHVELKGDIMRVKYIKFFGQFGIYNDTSLSGTWNTEISKTLTEHNPMTGYLRIIVCRMKKGGGETPNAILYHNPNDEGVENPSMIDASYYMLGPLQQGITSQYDIIKNKVIKVDIHKPYKLWKIKLNAKKLGYIYRKPLADGAVGENELCIYWQFICPNLLRYIRVGQNPINVSVGPQLSMTMNATMGYVDQN